MLVHCVRQVALLHRWVHSHASCVLLASTRDRQRLHARHVLQVHSQQLGRGCATSALLVSSVGKEPRNVRNVWQDASHLLLDLVSAQHVVQTQSH